MSAFVVSPATMNRVVYGLAEVPAFAPSAFGCADGQLTRLGRVLYSLNLEAVQQRYPDTLDQPEDTPGPCEPPAERLPHTYAYEPPFGVYQKPIDRRGRLVACFKAMRCLRYQCSEGDVIHRPEYTLLSQYMALLAEVIVGELDEYEDAAWDAD